MNSLPLIDHNAIKANQYVIVTLNIAAYVLNQPWLAVFTAVAMLIGALLGRPAFVWLYKYLFRPLGMKPHLLSDHPEPHRFAQGLGGIFMLGGGLALLSGFSLLGWGLVWLVAALAALNAFGGFCAGCFLYYWLSRMHVPGFSKMPPEGAFPGLRPKE